MIHNTSSIQREKVRTMQKDIRGSKMIKKTNTKDPIIPNTPAPLQTIKPTSIPEQPKDIIKTATPLNPTPTPSQKPMPTENPAPQQPLKPIANINDERPISTSAMPGVNTTDEFKKPDTYRERIK